MKHTHYALFNYDDNTLVAILPKDFKDAALFKALEEEVGSEIESVVFDRGMLGRSMNTPVRAEFEDLLDQFYLQPTWLYENE